jgi:hypothetical protein
MSTNFNTENDGRKGVDEGRNRDDGRELQGRYKRKGRELYITRNSVNEAQNWCHKKHNNWDHRSWIEVGHYFILI